MIGTDLPPWLGVELDVTVWLCAAGTTLLTAIAVIALPVAHASRADVGRVLRQESHRSAGSRAQQTTRRLLLGGQAAFATLLLVMAALFGGVLRELLRVGTGFDSRGVLTFRVDPPWGRYPDIATTSEFYRRATESLAMTVVGLVGNVRFSSLDDDTGLEVYTANTQLFAGDSYIVLRTRTDAAAVRHQLRAAIDAVDRDQSFFDVQTMDARIQRAVWQHRIATTVLALFAVIALCLAVIGTHAVTAQAVASARREIGIRLALGSPASQVVWLVMQRWLGAVAAGVAVGVLSGALVARVLAGALGLPTAPDLLLPTISPIMLAGAAAVACYLPVRRALRRHDLIDALRPE